MPTSSASTSSCSRPGCRRRRFTACLPRKTRRSRAQVGEGRFSIPRWEGAVVLKGMPSFVTTRGRRLFLFAEPCGAALSGLAAVIRRVRSSSDVGRVAKCAAGLSICKPPRLIVMIDRLRQSLRILFTDSRVAPRNSASSDCEIGIQPDGSDIVPDRKISRLASRASIPRKAWSPSSPLTQRKRAHRELYHGAGQRRVFFYAVEQLRPAQRNKFAVAEAYRRRRAGAAVQRGDFADQALRQFDVCDQLLPAGRIDRDLDRAGDDAVDAIRDIFLHKEMLAGCIVLGLASAEQEFEQMRPDPREPRELAQVIYLCCRGGGHGKIPGCPTLLRQEAPRSKTLCRAKATGLNFSRECDMRCGPQSRGCQAQIRREHGCRQTNVGQKIPHPAASPSLTTPGIGHRSRKKARY